MDRRYCHPVVPGPVTRGVLQLAKRRPQRLALPWLDPEEQAELTRRADGHARPGCHSCIRCHSFAFPGAERGRLTVRPDLGAVHSQVATEHVAAGAPRIIQTG